MSLDRVTGSVSVAAIMLTVTVLVNAGPESGAPELGEKVHTGKAAPRGGGDRAHHKDTKTQGKSLLPLSSPLCLLWFSLLGALNAGDYRLQGSSPCIDAGYNDPSLPATDIAGMHRIMNGGKSQTVDMGAWEYYLNAVSRAVGGDFALTWSLSEGKTYSIFYTDEVFKWHLATDSFSSSGDTTTVWVDDGSLTGIPSSLAPCRFYRLLENP